jgi:DNA-binding transcriptional LysR family regulator
MHIHSVRYFLAVADCNSSTQAAIENNISQSSLSKRIKSLEDEFHVTLFDRSAHKPHLTDAGAARARTFVEFAQNYFLKKNQSLPDSVPKNGQDGRRG